LTRSFAAQAKLRARGGVEVIDNPETAAIRAYQLRSMEPCERRELLRRVLCTLSDIAQSRPEFRLRIHAMDLSPATFAAGGVIAFLEGSPEWDVQAHDALMEARLSLHRCERRSGRHE
jgi:hypothetical protein